MSALLSTLARDLPRTSWVDWLPGSMALVLRATALLLLVARETARGALSRDGEHRAAATSVLVVPLLLAVALVFAVRLVEVFT